MDQQLKTIADLEFAQEMERLRGVYEQTRRAAINQAAARGSISPAVTMNIDMEHIDGVVRAYATIWLNLLEEKNSGVLTRQHVDFIGEGIKGIAAARKSSILNHRPGLPHNSVAAIAGEISRRTDSIVASACRDLEIRLRRQEAGLRKDHKENHAVHISITNAANVNLGTQVGTITAALNTVAEQGPSHREFAQAIKQVSDLIAQSSAISDPDKQQALQVISELVNQAGLKPEDRSTGTVKALVTGFASMIGTAADVTTLWLAYSHLIRTFFAI
jgi:hypothetical protein